MSESGERVDPLYAYRQLFALPRDVLVLSVAMFAFSLGFQMTGRYLPRYIEVLGGGAVAIGLYKTVSDVIGFAYPYVGGVLSDRVGSRSALTTFGLVSTLGFGVWFLAPDVPGPVPAWVWILPGLFLAQAWKSFGLGATFAVVKQSVPSGRLAEGFAATEVFRRVGFLVGPLLAAAALASATGFAEGFRLVLVVALVFGLVATAVQHVRYESETDTFGTGFEGVATVLEDLRSLPGPLRPLLVADTFVRFANGMVYAFWVIVVTDFLSVGFTGFGLSLNPDAYFGVLLGVEMAVALLVMVPFSRLANRVGLKPVVALGFLVYATFPALLITAPADQWALAGLFAFSGLRFAGLPSHKALIVGPAEKDQGGRVTGTYYLVRNLFVIPSGLTGGVLYRVDPVLSFLAASGIGLVGTALFLAFGREFEAYV
ncbi:MAG: MFS transporter [Haloarculaceae archaeon]